MARQRIARAAALCAATAASAAALVCLAVGLAHDGDQARTPPDGHAPALDLTPPEHDAVPTPEALNALDADPDVPDLIELDGLLEEEEVPDELPADLFLSDDGADDATARDTSARAAAEGTLPPLLTQEVPLATVVDAAELTAPLAPRVRCLLAGLAIVEGASVPAELALAVARAAEELAGAPTAAARLHEAARADIEQLGAHGLAEAPAPGRIVLHPSARAAGVELLAALPEVAAEHLGDAALRWWSDFALGGSADAAAIARETAGLRGALLWARERGRHRALLELVQVLSPLLAQGALPAVDERTCYEWASAAAAEMGDGDGQLWAAHQLARVLLAAGEAEWARAQLDEALALSAHLGRLAERREELHALAVLDAQEGDAASAWTLHQEALTLARQVADARGQREELHSLAVLDAQGGRVAEARAGFQAALELAQAAGDLSAERAERHALAVLEARDGRVAEARTGFQAALELARHLGDRRSERTGLHELAALDARAGDVVTARAGFEAALALARELGDSAAESTELQALGFRDLNMGRLREAHTELHEALALARQTEQPILIARALWSCAELDARLGSLDDAREQFLEALALYERLGDPDAHNGYIRLRLRELGHAD